MIKLSIPTIVLTLLSMTASHAIDIKILRYNHSMVFVVDGPIEYGDAEKFKKVWEDEAYDAFRFSVALDSPGGNLAAGIELGEFFREVNLTTVVAKYSPRPPLQEDWEYSSTAELIPGAECHSACALAFMGGLERTVDADSKIGFHQFAGKDGSINGQSHSELQTNTQSISALISSYLRRMGAKQELFEVMSSTPPDEMYILSNTQLNEFTVTSSDKFQGFTLQPKSNEIVASAVNALNSRGLQKLYEIEFFCLKGNPTMNLYAQSSKDGLSHEQISFIDGSWWISNDTKTYDFEKSAAKLYPNQRIMATLTLDQKIAREVIRGNFSLNVNSTTADGFHLGGHIYAPDGDKAIAASLKTCL